MVEVMWRGPMGTMGPRMIAIDPFRTYGYESWLIGNVMVFLVSFPSVVSGFWRLARSWERPHRRKAEDDHVDSVRRRRKHC